MTGSRRANDQILTDRAVPAVVVHLALPVVAVVGAVLLIPFIGWQFAIVGTALLGMLLPQSLGGWLSIACVAIGMLASEPGVGQAMGAVLFVHVLHVLSSLLPVLPWRGKVILRALWPTVRSLLIVQLIAQPLTLAVMLTWSADGTGVWGAALVGATGVVGFAVFFLARVLRRPTRN